MDIKSVIDCRPTQLTLLQEVILRNYEAIAIADLEHPIQQHAELEKKALTDLRRIGDVRGLRILEIGPGGGHLTRQLVRSGAVVDVCDIAEAYLSRFVATEVNYRYLAFVEEPTWVSKSGLMGKYDLVVLCDVLEHLTHPVDALLNIRQLMKNDGRAYLRVPANESLLAYSRAIGCPYELVHLRTYTKTILKRELRACGYKVRRIGLASEALTPRSFLGNQKRFWAHQRRVLTGERCVNRDHPYGRSLLVRVISQLAARSWVRIIINPLRPLLFVQQEIWVLATQGD